MLQNVFDCRYPWAKKKKKKIEAGVRTERLDAAWDDAGRANSKRGKMNVDDIYCPFSLFFTAALPLSFFPHPTLLSL